MKPVARTDRLIRQVVGQETLVYDPADDSACCLNPLAALVWRQCDGTHSVDEIAALVATEMSFVDSAVAEEAVWRVLDELENHHLLVADSAGAVKKGMGRREVVKAMALLPFFPAILQITAPHFSTGASPAPSPTPSVSGPVPSATPTPTPTMTTSPSASPTPVPSVSASGVPSPSPTPPTSSGPVPSASPTPTPTPTPT